MTKLAKSKMPGKPPEKSINAVPLKRRAGAVAYKPQAVPVSDAPAGPSTRRFTPPVIEWSPPLIKRSLLVGSTLLAGALLILTGNLLNPGSLLSARDPNAQCQGKVQSQSVISRDQLGQFLTVAERDPKAKVRQIVKAPYCTLPTVEVRAGVKAEREAYPLAFDPQTRLVILYEGDEYAGYAFDVRR